MPPRIEESASSYNVTEGNMVILPCVTYAIPPANIKWTHINAESSTSELDKYVMFDGSLQLKAKFSDSGRYICEAANEAGVASSEMLLNVYSMLFDKFSIFKFNKIILVNKFSSFYKLFAFKLTFFS